MAVTWSRLGFLGPVVRAFSSGDLIAVLLMQNFNLQVFPQNFSPTFIAHASFSFQVVPVTFVFPWYCGMRYVKKLKDSPIRQRRESLDQLDFI